MKKIISLVLAMIMLLTLPACDDTGGDERKERKRGYFQTSEEQAVSVIPHTGKKLEGEITGASMFSEGLAFVQVDGDDDMTYCINKDGYIVFELQLDFCVGGEIDSKFVNGLAPVNGGLCNTKGEITYPEDVGVTAFSELALEDGYVFAEKVTADYASTKSEMGIMNTDFEWTVQPSEAMYLATNGLSMLYSNSQTYYHDDIAYWEHSNSYINMKTGEPVDAATVRLPSFKWVVWTDKTFRDYNDNVMLNLSQYENIRLTFIPGFVNGKCPVYFYNNDADKHYFTIIDEQGNFAFSPVEIPYAQKDMRILYDGEYALIMCNSRSDTMLLSYDSDGNLLGELDTEPLGNGITICQISEGIIVVWKGGLYGNNKAFYYNTDFTPLF